MSESPLFHQLAALRTEHRNPRSMKMDSLSTREILELINSEDAGVASAVADELEYIEQAVKIIVSAFDCGGRLIYAGAGTSGRLGILDAAECPPTFGTPPEMVRGLIAGGKQAVFKAVEGAEDFESNGEKDVQEIGLSPEDVLCGIAASRRTPYVVGAVREARRIGAKTLFVTCNPREQFDLHDLVDVAICVDVGPEVLMGSTRMKSGTAQKMVLNMLTTTAMIRIGKVYENMMIDLQLTNEKLVERSRRIVMMATGVDYEEASTTLDRSQGHVKTALVMILKGVSVKEASDLLKEARGHVRAALEI